MYKMPVGLRIVVFILILILQIGIFNLIVAVKTVKSHNLIFNENEYQIVHIIQGITAILLGMFFCNIFKSWTPEELISKAENVESINNYILGLQQKKMKIILKNPELKIYDYLHIIMTDHEIKGAKNDKR
jgi:hypothetical protein